MKNEAILRFSNVSFGYEERRPLLTETDFSIRRFTKTTIMGQNGAGKSTIFGLITRDLRPDEGSVTNVNGLSIAIARQVILRDEMELTVRDFFHKYASGSSGKKIYNIDVLIDEVLDSVNLKVDYDKLVGSLSGGQQARMLLASALIQKPDLLLLDEPTNNLDKEGIEHLSKFLIDYNKTCIVISHDAKFLNSFTDGVLYLDIFTGKIEQYAGNYFDVQEQILARQERENRKNAQLAKGIQENKDKANFFAKKGGRLRLVAKKMREKADEFESEKVETRKEDKTIRPFVIPSQENMSGVILEISKFNTLKDGKVVERKANIEVRRNEHLLLKGPNGIGKSTLLESIAKGASDGSKIASGVKVGYYRQDFSTLNFEDTVYESISETAQDHTEQKMRGIAASLLITGEMMKKRIGDLSEGQKGLVSFAKLVLQRPGLLILDEPTNHINFRHIPVIADALNKYDGAMVLVSHVPEFVRKIRIDETLDLES